MTRHHARAARRERQGARMVGSRRVVRARGEHAPDVIPVTLPSGLVLAPEVKERARPLATVHRWLTQAEGYATPGAAPVLLVFATGQHAGEALVVMRARDWRCAVGLDDPPRQGPLPFPRAARPLPARAPRAALEDPDDGTPPTAA